MNVTYALPLPTAAHLGFHRPPLAGGYLAAYAQSTRGGRDTHVVLHPDDLASCEDAETTVRKIAESEPDVVALSVYVWNRAEVAEITKALRTTAPGSSIVVGGPEVAFEPARAFEDLQIDWVCTGEGEIAFTRLLDALEEERERAPAGMVSAASLQNGRAVAPLVATLTTSHRPTRLDFSASPATRALI